MVPDSAMAINDRVSGANQNMAKYRWFRVIEFKQAGSFRVSSLNFS
jgi:flavin-binding protein dodecin